MNTLILFIDKGDLKSIDLDLEMKTYLILFYVLL